MNRYAGMCGGQVVLIGRTTFQDKKPMIGSEITGKGNMIMFKIQFDFWKEQMRK